MFQPHSETPGESSWFYVLMMCKFSRLSRNRYVTPPQKRHLTTRQRSVQGTKSQSFCPTSPTKAAQQGPSNQRSTILHQKAIAKHHDHAKRKGKGKNTTPDSEGKDSENSEVEDNGCPLADFKPPSKTQRRNTKPKTTERSRNTKYPTDHGVTKGKNSHSYAGIKPLFSRTDCPTVQRKRGMKRDRNPYGFENGSTEESTDESSGAEMNASSFRLDHEIAKRKRLKKVNEIDEEVRRRAARALAKANSIKTGRQVENHRKIHNSNNFAVGKAMDGLTLSEDASKAKARSQNGNRKKLDKTNEPTGSTGRDLAGATMDGLTLGENVATTDGLTAENMKHGESCNFTDEESKEPERPETRHV
ncbi:hypothetical protein PENCOP_c007G00054 [Penicillium coprophilum]|uniref:Uncharacterized protein n=1 Tax=Penicillium coprophilum TaxID=36646 RepID=A0A1V6ULG4_9EURO|nr:hypothetical protein PENCOP_c007G00054 [Penicillium coprophilum]